MFFAENVVEYGKSAMQLLPPKFKHRNGLNAAVKYERKLIACFHRSDDVREAASCARQSMP